MEDQQCVSVTPKQKESLPPLVAMFPSPGMGHLIPMIEFAKRLVRHHDLHVTFIIPTDGPPSKAQTTVLHSLPRGISHIFLPPVTLCDLPPNTKIEPLVSLTVFRSLPSLHHTLLSLMSCYRVAALLVDLFGTDAFDVATQLNVPSYVYFPSTAMVLSFVFYLPQLEQECEFRDLPEPVNIPGCVPVHGKDLVDPVQDRNGEAYKCLLHHAKRYRLAKGIIENSFLELEPNAIKLLQKAEPGRPPVANDSNFIADSHVDPFDFLPKGFVERTKGRRLVVPYWAPQAQVLSHASTGGFVTHCGWNSVLESVVNGVPLVAWPLYAEQKMNAVLLTEDVKVALRPKVGESGLVERQEIARVVKMLMEGEEGKKLRYRMKDLKEAAATTLKENGSSTKQICELALEWKGAN